MTTATLIAVPAAAVAAFAASGAFYGAFGAALAPADGPARSVGATAAVELARNVVLAAGAAALLAVAEVAGLGPALLLAAGLWVAFPVVLLAGSVFHEHVPAASAALHAGDWLLKLAIVLGVVAVIGT